MKTNLKVSEISKEIKNTQTKLDQLERLYRREKLKVLQPELRKLVGKCYKSTCKSSYGDGEIETYYKVLRADPNFNSEDNQDLTCFTFQISPNSYGGKHYEVREKDHMYQHIISEGEISPSEYDRAFEDMLEEIQELNV